MAQDPNIPTQQDADIEPLSDESLEEVAGGCSGAFCSHSA
jgi:hypothetical protein